jgi:hypothetical protein
MKYATFFDFGGISNLSTVSITESSTRRTPCDAMLSFHAVIASPVSVDKFPCAIAMRFRFAVICSSAHPEDCQDEPILADSDRGSEVLAFCFVLCNVQAIFVQCVESKYLQLLMMLYSPHMQMFSSAVVFSQRDVRQPGHLPCQDHRC